jgi:lincosamide and streptogramin A transport system ATP-binding/permease protein
MQIEELLLKYEPTIQFVEHDSEFCKKIATKAINLQHENKKHKLWE